MSHETAQIIPTAEVSNLLASPGQVMEIATQIAKHYNGKILKTVADRLVGDPSPVFEALDPVLISPRTTEEMLADWTRFWARYGFEVGEVVVPERRAGFDRLLVIPKGLTIMRIIAICKGMFKVWRWINEDLDKIVIENVRTNSSSYAIWIRPRVEADEEFKNKSANTLKRQNHDGITLLERLVYEAKYFKETGKHLDIKNKTLCSGSRDHSGFALIVYWYGDYFEVSVHWVGPNDADDDLRSREVVAAPKVAA